MTKPRGPSNNDATVSQALSKLVSAGKKAFRQYFSEEYSFDSAVWPVKHLRDRSVTNSNPTLHFTRLGSIDDPLPVVYGHVIKSWILIEYRLGTRSAVPPLNSARILWEAILNRRKNSQCQFEWTTLCDEDLNQAEMLMLARWQQSTTYKSAGHLISLSQFVARHAIARPLNYVPQTPRIEDSNRHTIAGREERRARLPTEASLRGLAEIYRVASDPADQMLSAAIAITAVAGFRVGELLTLPHDCEIEEVRGGKPRYGLRYYKEKNKEDEKLFAVRWLTPIQAELAHDAIRRIRSITETFRHRAKILENNPDRVSIPGFDENSHLGPKDLKDHVGIVGHASGSGLKRHQNGQSFFYLVSDVEKYLLGKRIQRLWTVDRRDGSHQMLSETLLIGTKNFFHSKRGTCALLIEPVNVQHISDFLGGKTRTKSAFERFGITEPDGRFCQMTSHQLRYWLNDVADKGGLPVDTLTRWMGRENPRDTEAYRFETADEKCKRIRDGIRAGEIHGHISDLYFSLPVDEREIFIESQVQSVHFTPMGICAHDYSLLPCDRHLNCVRGTCPDYLRTKGNQNERTNLIQIMRNTELALKRAQDYAAANNADLAPAWVKHHQDTITGVKAALAIDDDFGVKDGDMIRPFNPSDRSSDCDLQVNNQRCHDLVRKKKSGRRFSPSSKLQR